MRDTWEGRQGSRAWTATAAAALLVASVVLSGCARGAPGPGDAGDGGRPTTSPAGAPAACGGHAVSTGRVDLGPSDSGHTVCVAAGTLVSVVLEGTGDRPWRFEVQGSVLAPATDVRFALPVGRQGAAYRGTAAGEARLLGTRPACPSPSSPGAVRCGAVQQGWSVAVVVV